MFILVFVIDDRTRGVFHRLLHFGFIQDLPLRVHLLLEILQLLEMKTTLRFVILRKTWRRLSGPFRCKNGICLL